MNHLAIWPGNANLPIGAARNANREIGVPGFPPRRFAASGEFGLDLYLILA
jgi:hypothetical protein